VHPDDALAASGGVARWSDLARLGVGRGRLLALVREGVVARPARGVFCRPDLVDSDLVKAVASRGALTCAAGARAYGLDLLGPPGSCHLRVPDGAARQRAGRGVVLHPWGRAGATYLAPVVTVLHDCAVCLAPLEAVVVIDSALRLQRIDAADLADVVSAGPRPAAVRRILTLVDPASQSVLESVARVALVLEGMGPVASQVYVEQVGWVDLVVDGWLVIELDGWEYHRERFREDRRRDAELTRRGLVVLRFTHRDLMHRREWFIGVVAETLDRGRPPFALRRSG
jgi:very-short-patch-repair endonuclease